MHPNLPSRTFERSVAKYGSKTIFVLAAIFAPEYGVFMAFRQFQQARSLVKELSRLEKQDVLGSSSTSISAGADRLSERPKAPTDFVPHVQRPYSLVFGFYVLMGGLAVNVSPIHDRLQTVLLTPNGVLHLARKGHFIHVSDKDIKDKSKANVLAKALVLLQVSWTMLQCLSRKAAGLPISVLEFHTLVHAACALVMYCLWFNKPMDVEEPTLVLTDEFESDIALMLIRNHRCGVQPIGNLVLPTEFETARYAGARYRDWPGFQASEASYLVFNPAWDEKSNQSSNIDVSLEAHLSKSHIRRQSVHETAPGTIASHARRQRSPIWNVYGLGPVSNGIHPLDPSGPVTTSQSILSAEQGAKDAAGYEYRGNRIVKFIAPAFYQRRKAAYEYKSPRLLDTGPFDSELAKSQDVWLGFHSYPPTGVPIQYSVLTGDIAPGGIGPNTFMVGNWIGTTCSERQEQPSMVVEISEHLKQQLPLHKINGSSVRTHYPLKISLSQKDLRRWQLAGSALRREYPSPSVDGHRENRLVDFSGPGGSTNDVYFVTNTITFISHMVEELFAVRFAAGNRHILALQGLYHQLTESDSFGWTSSISVIVSTAFLYAALHLALWNHTFPTTAEKILWRISASTLLAVPTLVLVCLLVSTAYQRVTGSIARAHPGKVDLESNTTPQPPPLPSSSKQTNNNTTTPDFTYPTLTTINLIESSVLAIFCIAVLYLFSRIFIIVESFLSLRHVPVGVYAGVGWSKYIPHL
ncbi:MAG: hypothetical protein Q9225_000307 [Loekoesia sp. 1 TL-2023]